MTEPYATTLNLESVAERNWDDNTKARESFGILYRENFSLSEVDILKPTLAGALFAYDKTATVALLNALKQSVYYAKSLFRHRDTVV